MRLERLADALVGYVRGPDMGVGGSIPKVVFEFTHDPTDTPELANSWGLKVIVAGIDRIDNEGVPVEKLHREFLGAGATPEEAMGAATREIKAHIDGMVAQRQAEVIAIEYARDVLESDKDLRDLWIKPEAVEVKSDAQRFEALVESGELKPPA